MAKDRQRNMTEQRDSHHDNSAPKPNNSLVSVSMGPRGGLIGIDMFGKIWIESFKNGSVFPVGWEVYKNQFDPGVS